MSEPPLLVRSAKVVVARRAPGTRPMTRTVPGWPDRGRRGKSTRWLQSGLAGLAFAVQEPARRDIQGPCYLGKYNDRRITNPALHAADVRAMEVARERQLLLR